ncbi:MAG TPA: 16S rRNA (adenine(1518)-N(6)/adenine(1519)-N(6))-dimethyltransferase RsmA [Chitinophagaceae bacterium]|nr:16S rRNA (adenine(1518)-N(6)/adenine(1519)-N(6))-dimethyltransferase RsmA [Chitinophagaceae bacterium]
MYTLKKSLGQHFLKDENVCRRIVDQLRQRPFRQLLEVGPGGGALTKYLLQLPGVDFRAVELDQEKVDFLVTSYPELTGRIIHRSFLEIDPPFSGPFTVIGNFPYNISSQILFKVLDWKDQVECVIGMFQKEVAQRVAASPGSKTYGVISVLVQAFYEVTYLFEVSESCFQPPPKVKSAVIRLVPRSRKLDLKDERRFFLLVKTAFNQRRKTLRNAVRGLFDPAVLEDPVFQRRAEQLSLEEFAALSEKMKI